MMGATRARNISIIVLIALVICVGAYLAIRPTAQVPKTIKIGWPTPITGSLSSFGEADPWLAAYITKVVNEQQGGIYLSQYGQKVPIEILLRDTKSDPAFAASVTQDLIVNDKVDLIIATHTPTMVLPITSVCEEYKVPCIATNTPVLAWLSGAPYSWSYLNFWTEPDVAEVYVGIWDLVKNQTNMKVGGLWNNDSDGITFRDATLAAAKAHGYDVVGDEGLSPYGTADYSSYINDWKQKGVDIVTGNFIPPDFATLWRQCKEMGFHPKVVTIGRSILFPSAMEELGGDLPLGLTTEVWASKYSQAISRLTGLTPKQLADLWENESGKQWTQPIFCSHGAFEIAVDALTRAGSLDKEKIREAIADTDLDTVIGHVSYKAPLSAEEQTRYQSYPALIQYKDHYSLATVVGGQWVKGAQWPWDIQVVYNWKYNSIPETASMIVIPQNQ